MKKRWLAILLCLVLALSACANQAALTKPVCTSHTDADNNALCDSCTINLWVSVDVYGINDLHGKIADADTHPGVDEMSTYFRNAQATQKNVILLSAGDMWQGSTESNMTKGALPTQWMNELDFAAMTLGNHEFDWGEEPIEDNEKIAQFPFLAINIYDRETNQQVSYCQSSVIIECDGVQVGIIGAMGDCYSSIAGDKVQDIYFITDDELTQLVKEESAKLRAEGVDFVIYVLHDGFEDSKGASVTQVSDRQLASYYDASLSDGFVDLVFEGHTHQRYLLQDEQGVYHLQNGGDNKGISHAKLQINMVTGDSRVIANLVSSGTYAKLDDDPVVQDLLKEFESQISPALREVGYNAKYRNSKELCQLVADAYLRAGTEKWGDEYDIVLGGGFMSIRDPGELPKGEVSYAMLQGMFPFDNELVLCSIKGSDLQKRFIETDNSRYYVSYSSYGNSVRNNIDPNKTYYVIVDSYSSPYAPNRLTEVARYGAGVYARDLLADYIEAGGLE